jgi:hypothetical protein
MAVPIGYGRRHAQQQRQNRQGIEDVMANTAHVQIIPVSRANKTFNGMACNHSRNLARPNAARSAILKNLQEGYIIGLLSVRRPVAPGIYSSYLESLITCSFFAYGGRLKSSGGSQVWLYACWANPRTQSGPACAPVTAYLQGAAAHAA